MNGNGLLDGRVSSAKTFSTLRGDVGMDESLVLRYRAVAERREREASGGRDDTVRIYRCRRTIAEAVVSIGSFSSSPAAWVRSIRACTVDGDGAWLFAR
jgi:hypothetical protein